MKLSQSINASLLYNKVADTRTRKGWYSKALALEKEIEELRAEYKLFQFKRTGNTLKLSIEIPEDVLRA